MLEKGIQPNIMTYNTIIHGVCKEGRMRDSLKILNEMGDLVPNNVSYTTLIDGYCREDNLNGGFKLWDEMIIKGLVPGMMTYNVLLHKLCEEAREIL